VRVINQDCIGDVKTIGKEWDGEGESEEVEF
jgi:hypothetical protein